MLDFSRFGGLQETVEHLEWCLDILTKPSDDVIEDLGLSDVHLTGCERRIIGILASRDGYFTVEQIHVAMHWDRPDVDWPYQKTLDIQLWKLRQKLKGTSVKIKNLRSVGYRLTPHPKGKS